jgi:hypothetical protein
MNELELNELGVRNVDASAIEQEVLARVRPTHFATLCFAPVKWDC